MIDMKICQIVSHVDEEASGPSYSVPGLCEALASPFHDITLATLRSRGNVRQFAEFTHREFDNSGHPRKLGISKPMKSWFMEQGEQFDILHGHGLWMMPNIYPAHAASKFSIPYIVAPRGTMSMAAMKYSPWIKSLFWAARQKSALQKATGFHATSEEEYMDIRRAGFSQPVAIIPNGIDVAPVKVASPVDKNQTLVSLGRIHHKKGLDMAIQAWRQVQDHFPDWSFRIIGKGDARYIETLQQLIDEVGARRISLEGALYGVDKLQALRSANLFILPTRNENFGMVVAEALAQSVPVITTRGAPWEGLVREKAGWWVNIGVDPLKDAMEQAFHSSPDCLADMGERGHDWMARDFSWQTIGQNMTLYYKWIIEGGELPLFVRTE